MALFGSDKKSEQTSQHIRPTIVRTQTVAKELMFIAKSHKVNMATLDFNILSTETYTRVTKENVEVDWEEVESDRLSEIDDATAILNPHFEIKQMHEIEVFTKRDEDDIFKGFHAAVGANATKCKVYLSIKAGSKISVSDDLEEKFLEYINKSKIRAGILIGIFDEMVHEFASRVSAHAKVDGSVSYKNKETVLVSNAYEPTATIDDELILHYEKTEEVSEADKVDYSQRGFIKSVMENDLIIEYIKAKLGKPGRNCRGEFMEPKEPETSSEPTFSIDDSIEEIDNKDNIEYRAKESGYIALDGTMYQIKSDMDIDKVDFRSTGSITAGIDSDVVLNVKENDPERDAIGSGMEVEVKEIDVVGNVGSHAKIHARRATIEGQTHQSSELKADELTINVHKGMAIGKNITITRLENGIVNGEIVSIEQATGGTISAKEIDISICASHVKATASKLIEIHKLQGKENTFTIDPLVQQDKQNSLDNNQKEIKELESSIRDIKAEIIKYTRSIQSNTASFNDVKKRLVHYKKNGIKMPASFVNKFKQFQKLVEHLEAIKKECLTKEDKLSLLTTQTASFQDSIFDARIINRDRWAGHNEIVFKLVDPPLELMFAPPEGSTELIFAIVKKEDDEYEIQAVDE